MFSLVPFQAAHLAPLLAQEMNAAVRPRFAPAGVLPWLEKQHSFTVEVRGAPMVCGGITAYWPGRGHVWTVFNEDSKHFFRPALRGIEAYLNRAKADGFTRIEISVPCHFDLGKRRAELLGFRLETAYAENYLPDGGDASIYVMTTRGGR